MDKHGLVNKMKHNKKIREDQGLLDKSRSFLGDNETYATVYLEGRDVTNKEEDLKDERTDEEKEQAKWDTFMALGEMGRARWDNPDKEEEPTEGEEQARWDNFTEEVEKGNKEYLTKKAVEQLSKAKYVEGINNSPLLAVPSIQEEEIQSPYHVSVPDKPSMDIYDVLKAFKVTDHVIAHTIKKCLRLELDGHKDKETEYREIAGQASRALSEYLSSK